MGDEQGLELFKSMKLLLLAQASLQVSPKRLLN
ncbi:hypothetical protein J2W15_004232 [Pseudarthrobacter sulfonivorans]|nr:hypothetical protein [Pseudarthrobacter sulfonivorans]